MTLDRQRMRRAEEIRLGMEIAHSKSDLDEAWFDAIENDPADVAETTYQVNSARQEARALANAPQV